MVIIYPPSQFLLCVFWNVFESIGFLKGKWSREIGWDQRKKEIQSEGSGQYLGNTSFEFANYSLHTTDLLSSWPQCLQPDSPDTEILLQDGEKNDSNLRSLLWLQPTFKFHMSCGWLVTRCPHFLPSTQIKCYLKYHYLHIHQTNLYL